MRVLLLVFALLSGCVAQRSGEVVRGISFSVEGRPFPSSLWVPQSDRALRSEMATRVSTWQSLLFPGASEPVWLDRARLDQDGRALELWMAEHGYFDAHFLRWDVKRHGRKGRRMHPVTIRGYLSEGEPSRIRSVTIGGIDDLPAALQGTLRAGTPLVHGHVFSSADYLAALAALRATLLESGYAFQDVTGSADAFPDEHAVDVTFQVIPGPPSRFGPVRITGVNGMPPDVVAGLVTFAEGDPFTPKDLDETRAALFGLRAFSVVNVLPSLASPETGVVPVEIHVRNTKWRRVELGPGLSLESGKGTVYGSADWEDTNLFGKLWQLKATATVGLVGVVAQDTTFDTFALSQVTVAPVVDVTQALTIPRVFGVRHWNWSFDVDGRVQAGVETGYRFFSPEVAPGLTWHAVTRHGRDVLAVNLGYGIRYFDYFGFTVDIHDILDSPLGLDLTDPYLLSMFTQHLTWDARDNPLSPTRGWYGALALAEAGGPALGNFDFVRSQGEIRSYLSVPPIAHHDPRLIVAARLGAGIIAPYGDGPKASVPYAERLYLGGGTSVRGWGANRLGPSTPTTDLVTGATDLVPAGGLFDLFGNLELRKALIAGVSVAAFTDVGRVWPTIADATFDGLQWTVGGGLRYATAIGPVRGDVGVRLGPDIPELPGQPRWTLHFGLSEAF
jgi:translocation and assembly module TamA